MPRNRKHDVWEPCCNRRLRPSHPARCERHRTQANRSESWLVVRSFVAMVALWAFTAWLTGATT